MPTLIPRAETSSTVLSTPPHSLLMHDNILAISQEEDKQTAAQQEEDRLSHAPAPKPAFYAEWWDEFLDREVSTITTGKQ